MKRLVALLLALLLFGPAWADYSAADVAKLETSHYFSLHLGETKVGYGHFSIALSDDGAYLEVSDGEMLQMVSLGETTVVETESSYYFALADGRLHHFESRTVQNGQTTRRRGQRVGQGISVETQVDEDSPFLRQYPMPKLDIAAMLEEVEWCSGDHKKGAELVTTSLDYSSDPPETEATYRWVERRPRLYQGETVSVAVVEYFSEGLSGTAELDDKAQPYEVVTAVFQARREPRQQAMSFEVSEVDTTLNMAMPVDRPLGNQVQELVLEVKGVSGYDFPEAPYQKDEILFTGQQLLHLSVQAGSEQPLSEDDRQKYLEETSRFDYNDSLVQDLAARIGGATEGDRERVKRVVEVLYGGLDKHSNRNADNASTVLRNQAGDCTEHTLLGVALCRALGIPARELSGVVYVDDNQRVFGHHAWVEVYLEGGWMAVDPTLGQFPADAAHILLGRERDLSGFNLPRQTHFEVVRVKSQSQNFEKPWFYPMWVLAAPMVVAILLLLGLVGGTLAYHFAQES